MTNTHIAIIILLILFLWLIPAVLYCRFGIFKTFYHNILGWHKPTDNFMFDGCSFHSQCKYCGKEIMQDGQGNWF